MSIVTFIVFDLEHISKTEMQSLFLILSPSKLNAVASKSKQIKDFLFKTLLQCLFVQSVMLVLKGRPAFNFVALLNSLETLNCKCTACALKRKECVCSYLINRSIDSLSISTFASQILVLNVQNMCNGIRIKEVINSYSVYC